MEIINPFRPGAGHMPKYLAGRDHEKDEFKALLGQDVILKNCILTGLRGVGKTVLLETFKPLAIQEDWLWAGTDLSESTSVSEENLATRIITDVSIVFAAGGSNAIKRLHAPGHVQLPLSPFDLDYRVLRRLYNLTPGLAYDKLKAVLEFAHAQMRRLKKKGIVFAYDEAQNLADHKAHNQFPLSLLLDVFQSLQRRDIPFMLVLTGLPTLQGRLVESRTYTERMFHVVTLGPLSQEETRDAVEETIRKSGSLIALKPESIGQIWQITKGYPYLVQYVCRELFDVWTQAAERNEELRGIPEEAIISKLDTDFFAGRWDLLSDRQRQLMVTIAWLENSDREFSVQEIVDKSSAIYPQKPFSNSSVNQMLNVLGDRGLTYKHRHGKYSFAVPLLDQFIMRQAYAGIPFPGFDDDVEIILDDDEDGDH